MTLYTATSGYKTTPMKPWQTLERVETPEGRLELRRRGARDFLITVSAGACSMTSAAHRSEDDLAEAGVRRDGAQPPLVPRVMLGRPRHGLHLCAPRLDQLPPGAEITVVDLNPAVVEDGASGPLAHAHRQLAVADRRVRVEIGDVAGSDRQRAPRRAGCDPPRSLRH